MKDHKVDSSTCREGASTGQGPPEQCRDAPALKATCTHLEASAGRQQEQLLHSKGLVFLKPGRVYAEGPDWLFRTILGNINKTEFSAWLQKCQNGEKMPYNENLNEKEVESVELEWK